MAEQHYDLIVTGSGPAGQKGAINAAKLGKRVAVVERAGMMGGASVHSGTIPSKTLREAVLYLTGFTASSVKRCRQKTSNRIAENGYPKGSELPNGVFIVTKPTFASCPHHQ
jgi:pyruvate/2-oxoglutarate dehydrogenase complex dihydrolipoamide dehydrogenase (E3) component